MLLRLLCLGSIAGLAAASTLSAQNDRWYPVASDTATLASAHPSPLRTWREALPLRRGIALWAHNGTPDSIAVPSVEVWDCVNIDVGCGRILTDTILAPGDSLILVTVRPRQWNAKYRFRWTHSWAPTGPTSEMEPPYDLPAWAVSRLEAATFVEHYAESGYLSPRTLEPDLDGDGTTDLAIAIQDHQGVHGVAILLARRPGVLVLGANAPDSYGYDFRAVVSWEMRNRLGAEPSGQRLRLDWADGTQAELSWSSGRVTVGPR